MTLTRERILVLAEESASPWNLREHLEAAGYEVFASNVSPEGIAAAGKHGVDLILLVAEPSDPRSSSLLAELKGSAATSGIRVILLLNADASERARGFDLGADDVLSHPWEPAELLARVRAQLRSKRALDESRTEARLAQEGQAIAHTAFQALAVTEKMTRDAFSLDRMLKVGVMALLLIAAVTGGIFFLYSRRAEKETKHAYAVIAQLERGVVTQEDLVARSRSVREDLDRSTAAGQRWQLERQSEELRARIASAKTGDVDVLHQQLAETRTRLRRIEDENRVAEGIIRSYVPSVCLLHVVVEFRDKDSGQRLRYAGLNRRGEPLKNIEGNPLFTMSGSGPEVRADFFGSGFLAAPGGRILTNRHLAEPWWKNDELDTVVRQGLEPVVAEMSAYFPDSPRAYHVEVQKISAEADLALLRGDLSELSRPVLALDEGTQGAVSGQPLVSVGYATGLAGILARAGEDAANAIVASTNGNARLVIAELAKQGLIRPVTTQGHIGDVMADKIVFDAQTTSGGSGGPLFNQDGKVIGVTFAVVKGFGGSNFGIPIRYALPLLAH